MKKLVLLFLLLIISLTYGYEKKSIVERYTNASCGPCASLNNAWYTVTTHDLVANNEITHLVYNVNWPGANDPMYLLNTSDNITRWTYYGVNSVPWVCVNGTTISTGAASNLTSAVTTGNSEFSPFKIVLTPEHFSNNVMNVHVKILRDITDTESYTKTRLKVALTERTVAFASPPGSNGESVFYSISRKMLPDGKGTLINVPAPGDSVEYEFSYVPSSEFLASVNMDSIRVVAFIQNDSTKFIYQSLMQDMVSSTAINSAFKLDSDLGAAPLDVQFTDYSSGANGNAITSWKWDFNNDGTIDATTKNPTHTFTQNGTYSVALTVSDGVNEKTRILADLVTIIGHSSNILVVNGLDFKNYGVEVTNFFAQGACFGDHQVDVWDLFGDQGMDYSVNSLIKQIDLYNRKIPNSILNLYNKVIWIGNNYSGDLSYFDQQQVVDYIKAGGNFLLAGRQGTLFMNSQLKDYCRISSFSGDLTSAALCPLDSGLVKMTPSGTTTLVNYVILADTSEAVPIFVDSSNVSYTAAFTMHNTDEGTFTFIGGRPYRFDLAASYANYNYIIDNYMSSTILSAKENNISSPSNYSLMQNYPNPFNPSTTIKYALPYESNVKISIYNSIGQLVQVLVDDVQGIGTYSRSFNALRLSSGVYIYSIQATSVDGKNNFFNSKKMLLIK